MSTMPGDFRGSRLPALPAKYPSVVKGPDGIISPETYAYWQAEQQYQSFFKSVESAKDVSRRKRDNKAGYIYPYKGITEPTDIHIGYSIGSARGVREKVAKINHQILREIAKKVAPIAAIHTVRIMQLKPFAKVSHNEDSEGFQAVLKDVDSQMDERDKKTATEIEQFLLYSGRMDFEGADEREDYLPQAFDMLTRDMMTIDQISLSMRKDKKGRLLDYWILDSATIKRTIPGMGYDGDKDVRFVQEVQGRVLDVFYSGEMLFYFHNRRSDILSRGYGFSYIEQSVDIITGWLFAMAYNKEVFNSSALPKGFLSFDNDKLDRVDLEELQREWQAMFRGVKGMWRTPFIQYGAKWQTMAPSNRDMEWNTYAQWLASWICAVHGIDSQEMGIRLNGAQNVLNENQEKKIAYSKDRGLRELLGFHATWMQKVVDSVPEWREFAVRFNGFEDKDQKAVLELDKIHTETYMTFNEKRKEKGLEPIENGDIINNPQFVQYVQGKEGEQFEQEQAGGEGEPGEGEGAGAGLTEEQEGALAGATDKEIREAAKTLKSGRGPFDDDEDYLEVEL